MALLPISSRRSPNSKPNSASSVSSDRLQRRNAQFCGVLHLRNALAAGTGTIYARLPLGSRYLTEMQIKSVGVIGAGQMGNGIAHVCALAGFEVSLNDLSRERIEAGLATINGNLARQVKSGKVTEAERDAALKRIRAAPSYEDFSTYDLIIESAVEDEQVKRG